MISIKIKYDLGDKFDSKDILKNKCNKARFVLPGFTTYYQYLKPHDINTRL